MFQSQLSCTAAFMSRIEIWMPATSRATHTLHFQDGTRMEGKQRRGAVERELSGQFGPSMSFTITTKVLLCTCVYVLRDAGPEYDPKRRCTKHCEADGKCGIRNLCGYK